MPRVPLVELEGRLDYVFSSKALLRQALTHRSHSASNNERLELLGDAVLDLVITRLLFDTFPDAREGQLSRFRARLVRQQTLAMMARSLDLGDFLIMGTGELRSGGFDRDSTLSDAFEAVLGAIYLDAGVEKVTALVEQLYRTEIENLSLGVSQKDAKTRLQEHLQARGEALPEYRVLATTGEAHAQRFTVTCRCPGIDLTTRGEGQNRRFAEQEAAAAALVELGEDLAGLDHG